jgi:hypothetical protein
MLIYKKKRSNKSKSSGKTGRDSMSALSFVYKNKAGYCASGATKKKFKDQLSERCFKKY